MRFTNDNFFTPSYKEESEEPEKVIIISCEGRNTEPEYFNNLKIILKDHISAVIDVRVVPKDDNKSSPEDVVCKLDEYLLEKYDYKYEYDQLWVVWDREKVDSRKKEILKMLPKCKEKNYNIALSNPLFEFWLLMHLVDITIYSKEDLFANKQISQKRKYIDKELSNLLDNGFNKKKGKFNKDIITIENVKRAISQEKLFENDVNKIIDNLGSNIGSLVTQIIS
jgi:hypothetical protein